MPIIDLFAAASPDVERLDRDRTCLILVVSPVEEHGPHLPLTTDIIEAEEVARRLVARLDRDPGGWTFLLYPPIPLGADTFPHAGSFSVSPSTVRRIVEEVGLALAREGFRHMLLASHHGGPRHNLALDAAARRLGRRGVRVLSLAGRTIVDLYFRGGLQVFYEAQAIPPEAQPMLNLDCHAGAFETSEILAIREDLVREGWHNLEPVLVPLEKLTPGDARRAAQGRGYFGAPALASKEMGEAYLEFVVDRVLPDVQAFLRGDDVPGMALRWRLLLEILSVWSRIRDWIRECRTPGPSTP